MYRQLTAAACAAGLLAGCATTAPNQAVFNAGPSTPAMSADSYLRGALACMDDLLARAGGGERGRILLVLPAEDPTGSVSAGMPSMVIDAALAMTRRSRYFTVTDFVTGDELDFNSVLVRTEVVEYDQGVFGRNQTLGLGAGSAEAGLSNNQTISSLALSIRLVDNFSRAVIPGASATHRIALDTRDRGADMRGEVGTTTGFLEFRISRSQALHQSVKTLIDLNMIQIFGEYAGVPYEQCLTRAAPQIEAAGQTVDAYEAMTAEARARAAADALRARGYFSGPGPSTADAPALQRAIAAYQRDAGLPVTGRVDLELFASLALGASAPSDDPFPQDQRLFVALQPASASLTPPRRGTALRALLADRRNPFLARASSRVQVSATLNRPGYLICFHISAAGDVVRIYPNAARPERRLAANEEIIMPNTLDRFVIEPAWRDHFTPGVRTAQELYKRREDFVCYARAQPFAIDWPQAWGPLNAPAQALPIPPSGATSDGSLTNLRILIEEANTRFGRPAWGQLFYVTMPPAWDPISEPSPAQAQSAASR